MHPRQRARSFGRRNSTNAPPTSLARTQSGLYRTRTPLEHVDSIVVYEDDHHPHDSPSASTEDLHLRQDERTPRRTGFPLASPVHEEEEASPAESVLNVDPEVSSDRTVAVDADGDAKVRQRQAWKGERNDAEERERIRRSEKGDTLVNEKNVEQGGAPDPRTRKWKDDIVSLA